MTVKTKRPARLNGVAGHISVDNSAAAKITMRHIDKGQTAEVAPLSPEEIRAVRDRARMSQAVFARHLNVTTGYVSQLERGAKHPTGTALVLLHVIRRKGIETIM
jgi:putative transcriptional regulator